MTADAPGVESGTVAPSRRHLLGLLAAGAGLVTASGRTTATGSDDGSDQAVTAFFGMVPREDMSHDDFVEYLVENHIPMAKDVLEQLDVIPLAYEGVVPDAPDESPFGALGWLTFASREDFEHVSSSERWGTVLDDLENFTRTDQNVVVVGDHRDNLATTG